MGYYWIGKNLTEEDWIGKDFIEKKFIQRI